MRRFLVGKREAASNDYRLPDPEAGRNCNGPWQPGGPFSRDPFVSVVCDWTHKLADLATLCVPSLEISLHLLRLSMGLNNSSKLTQQPLRPQRNGIPRHCQDFHKEEDPDLPVASGGDHYRICSFVNVSPSPEIVAPFSATACNNIQEHLVLWSPWGSKAGIR